MGDGFTADGILLIVEGDDILGGIPEILGGGGSLGGINSPAKNRNSTRGRNWTVRQWTVHFMYSQEWRKK